MKLFHRPVRRVDPRRVVLTPEQVKEIEDTRLFYQALKRPAVVTYTLLGLLIAFWGLSLICGADNDPETLVRMGAKINTFIDNGQPWRLVSPIFLHFGILHILFNGYALYLLGRIIENLYGKRRFIVLFFVSGIASIAASYVGSPIMSVGASGAIFGLLGAGAVVGFKYREAIPPAFRRFFGRGLLPWILLNLGLGLVIEGIDNYAHVGGLIAGGLTALMLQARLPGSPKEKILNKIGQSVLAVAFAGLALVTIALMLNNIFISQHLPLPASWSSFHVANTPINGMTPDNLQAIPNEEIQQGVQFVDRSSGFWIAAELESEKNLPLSALIDDLKREVVQGNEINQRSFHILEQVTGHLGGKEAVYARITFELVDHPLEYELELWMAPTSDGLVSVSCSAPKMFYAAYEGWCAHYVESMKI